MEVELDLCGLLNRLSVELGRLELILQHGFKRRVAEDHRAADELRTVYLPVLADLDLHNHGPAKAPGFGDGRIRQRNGFDQLQRLKLGLLDGCGRRS